jgi:HTH-type transcriptional regulator/antitoxin HigA
MTIKTKKHVLEMDIYFDLVKEFPLKRLATDADYESAVAFLGKIEIAGRTASAGGRDYAEALTQLIAAYEDIEGRLNLSHLKPLDNLKFLLAQSNMNVTALGKIIGSQGTASEVLNGDRSISKAMAHKLGKYFKLDYRLFL